MYSSFGDLYKLGFHLVFSTLPKCDFGTQYFILSGKKTTLSIVLVMMIYKLIENSFFFQLWNILLVKDFLPLKRMDKSGLI